MPLKKMCVHLAGEAKLQTGGVFIHYYHPQKIRHSSFLHLVPAWKPLNANYVSCVILMKTLEAQN